MDDRGGELEPLERGYVLSDLYRKWRAENTCRKERWFEFYAR